jgi:UDP-N-acetyl-D-mannosaminuronic acid dehydrogenase
VTRTNFPFDTVIVGGLGHVGLPLGLAFANKGAKVALYDVDEKKASIVRQGKMPFIEYDADPILPRTLGNGTLQVRTDVEAVSEGRTVIVTIGTPVDEFLNPQTRVFLDSVARLREHLVPEQTIIVRSTVYPRSCRQLLKMLETDGQSWHIAYCPERIAQGYAIRELATLPQLVAGLTEKAIDDACALFSTIAPKLIRVTMEEAELAKLFSNAWRYIQFAVANQFYMMSTEIGVDYDSVRKAMIDGYGRAATLPGAGFAAGPCLLKDTMQLAAFQRNHFLLGHAAMMINEGLPDFLVHTLSQTRDLATSKVGILGMAFKGDIDDTRASLSYKLGKRLRFHGATVFYSDEFARDPTFVSKEELVAKSDVVIVGAPHTAYRELEIPPGVELVDLWGILRAGSVLALPRSTARGG